jgi:hypothetical protein
MTKKQKTVKKNPPVVKNPRIKLNIVLLVILFGLFGAFLYSKNNPQIFKATRQILVNPALLSPTPTIGINDRPIVNTAAEGKQTYTIMMASHSPVFYKAVIDPEKVSVGHTQTMTVWVKDDESEIVSVVAEIDSDTKTQKYDLIMIEGSAKDGVWSGSWRVNDTHETTYATKFIAKNALGEERTTRLGWTDPGCCAVGVNGCTINTTCSISGTGGADNGRLYITTGGNVTVSSPNILVYSTDFYLDGTGILSVANGATFRKSNICMSDADSDGEAANTTEYAEDTCGSGRRRKYLITRGTADCCNTDNRAFHGQTAAQSTARTTCGGYDFNCDGTETKTYPCTADGQCQGTQYSCTPTLCWDAVGGVACGVTAPYVTSCSGTCSKETTSITQTCI